MTWPEGVRPSLRVPKSQWAKLREAIDLRNEYLRPGQKPYTIKGVFLTLIQQYTDFVFKKYR